MLDEAVGVGCCCCCCCCGGAGEDGVTLVAGTRGETPPVGDVDSVVWDELANVPDRCELPE